MSGPFPPELVDTILSHLSGTHSIRNCALVCRLWLPSSRHHLLRDKVLHLRNHKQILKFLSLVDSPHSTLSLIYVSMLYLNQFADERYPGDSSTRTSHSSSIISRVFRALHVFGKSRKNRSYGKSDESDENYIYSWLNRTSVSDFIVRNPLPVSKITSLWFDSLNWKTLTPSALASLQSSHYNSVKELGLRWMTISFEDICNLIAGFPVLEKIAIQNGLPVSGAPWNVDSVRLKHSFLSKLAFDGHPLPWVVQAFQRGIEYTNGIVEISNFSQVAVNRWKDLETYEGLLQVAGGSLRVLKFCASDSEDYGHTAAISNFLTLRRNTNLQEIHLSYINETVIRSLANGFRLYPKPDLRRLCVSIRKIDSLDTWAETWALFDTELSRFPLGVTTPTLVFDCPLYQIIFVVSEPDRYEILNEGDVSKKIRGMLPRMAESWSLELQFRHRSPTPDDFWIIQD